MVSERAVSKAFPTIRTIIHDEGFRLNDNKTRFAGLSRRRVVTGLVLNDNGTGIGRVKYRELRARFLKIASANMGKSEVEVSETEKRQIRGWLAYVKDVDPNRYAKLLEYLKKLSKEYPSILSVLRC